MEGRRAIVPTRRRIDCRGSAPRGAISAPRSANWTDPTEALAAFEQLLAGNPENHQALNNFGRGVAGSWAGWSESEAAFRRVIALTPGLAFGHYNLGHTLFLQGRYQASLAAYPPVNGATPSAEPGASEPAGAGPGLATGDAAGALTRAADVPPPHCRRHIAGKMLGGTHTVAWALLSSRGPGGRAGSWWANWLSAELARG